MKTDPTPLPHPSARACFKKLSAFFACFTAATLAHATVLLDENFDSLTAGGLNGQNGWTADAGLSVVSGGQSYSSGTLVISGGTQSAESSTVSSPLATTSFASQSSDIWMSFTLSVSNSVANDRYWFWLSDTTNINTGFTAAIGDTSKSNNSLYSEARVNTSVTDGTQTAYTAGQTVFLVARISQDGTATTPGAYDHIDLWVNPSSTTLGTATSSAVNTSSTLTSGITNFGLTALGATPTIQWDNLLVGTTQADVLNVYAIPEPSLCAAFVGLASLGLVIRRRRRAA